jgi:hypothetical protein
VNGKAWIPVIAFRAIKSNADPKQWTNGWVSYFDASKCFSWCRPKLKLFTSFDEACEAVQKAENEFLALLKKKGYETEAVSQPEHASTADGLTTIRQAAPLPRHLHSSNQWSGSVTF